jgi:hypothetical protein
MGPYGSRHYEWVRKRPLGLWLLDEGSGLTTQDVSGYGGTGTLNGPTWTRSPWGPALSFPGSGNNRVSWKRSPQLLKGGALSSSGFTIMALIRPSSWAETVPIVFDMVGTAGSGVTSTGPIRFYLDNFTIASGFDIRLVNAAGTENTYKFPNLISLNTWQLVGVTFGPRMDAGSTSPRQVHAYKDGRLAGIAYTSRIPDFPVTADPTTGALTDASQGFNGLIAGLWLWGYRMTAGQVARFTSAPFSAWRMDPTTIIKPGASIPVAPQGGGTPAIYRRRHGGL